MRDNGVTMGRGYCHISPTPPSPQKRTLGQHPRPIVTPFCHASVTSWGENAVAHRHPLAPPTSLQDDNGGRQWGGATSTLRPLPASSQKRSAEPSLQSPSRLLDLGVSSPRRKPHPERWQDTLSPTTRTEAARLSSHTSDGTPRPSHPQPPSSAAHSQTQAGARIARPGPRPSAHPLALSTSTPSCARTPILRPSRTARPALPSRARRVPVPCPFARSRSRRTVP